MDDGKELSGHVEVVDSGYPPDFVKPSATVPEDFDGDVNLAGPGDAVYLIPTPSPDPRGKR